MPPKSKFKKEEIVAAALAVIEREGLEGLTARSLAAELGSSARPIFTLFDSMEEVQTEAIAAAKALYAAGVEEGLRETPAFRGVGKAYIRFAGEHPKLFRLLFMRETKTPPDLKRVLSTIEDGYEKILSSVRDGYGLDEERSVRLYQHMWIYSHGIATLVATGVCVFSGEEISRQLTEVCSALISNYKRETDHDTSGKSE